MAELNYWYDGQLRRYWMQFVRIFQSFSYESGVGADGTKTLKPILAKLASKNRQIGHILRNGSENTVLSTPQITCEMIGMVQSSERRQNPNHVRTVNVWERAIDQATNTYTGDLGQTYSVETYMGVPYDIIMRMDLWTSNELQKHQIMEQILVLFNPSIDLQTGNNPIDWSSLTIVEIQDITWTNREMPVGTDDDIEVSSITFKMPIWINPPAKVKRQNIIQQIITNIGVMNDEDTYKEGQAGGYNFSAKDMHTRVITTPGNHQARMEAVRDPDGNLQFIATLLSEEGHRFVDNWRGLAEKYGIVIDEVDPTSPNYIDKINDPRLLYNWSALLKEYGPFRPGVSQFRLKTTEDMDDHESDIVGIFGLHPTNANQLWWQPDGETLPLNTLQTIGGIIDPNAGHRPKLNPDDTYPLPMAEEGQRYLLGSDLDPVEEWTNLKASVNDIIEFKNGKWVVSFDASAVTTKAVVLNGKSGKQLRWTGEMWVDAISGDYRPGYWRIFL